jgi:hypothetical protein
MSIYSLILLWFVEAATRADRPRPHALGAGLGDFGNGGFSATLGLL